MALTKDQKQVQISAFRDRLGETKSIVFVSYRGLSVENMGAFRVQLREKKSEVKVGKKTLFKIAAKEMGFPEVDDALLDGPVGFVFSFEDEMSGAKVSLEFGKKNETVQILGGVLNGKVLNKAEALELAKMLSKDELLAKFARLLQAPLHSFASLCSSPLRGFAMGVKQVAEKGGISGSGSGSASEGEASSESSESSASSGSSES